MHKFFLFCASAVAIIDFLCLIFIGLCALEHNEYGVGLCTLGAGLLGLMAGSGFLLGLKFRHRLGSPNLRVVLRALSLLGIVVVLLLNIVQFTAFWSASTNEQNFPPSLHWGWYLLVAMNYTLTIGWGVLMGLTNTRPGLSDYELKQ